MMTFEEMNRSELYKDYTALDECRDRYQKIVAREAAEAAREQYEKYAEILKIPDILTRLDKMEKKLEELERMTGDKQMSKINDQNTGMITLDEHNKKMKERYMKDVQPLTNIKCKKCSGVYRHQDIRRQYLALESTIHSNYPAKQKVICDSCGDNQFIIVWEDNRGLSNGEKVNETEEQPQPDEINDPISRFKPY